MCRCTERGGVCGVGVEGRQQPSSPLDTVCVTVKCELWNGPLVSRSMGWDLSACIMGIRVVTF